MLTVLLACRAEPDPVSRPEPTTAPAPTTPPPTMSAEVRALIDDAVAHDLLRNEASGASVAVWQDGVVLLAAGYGTTSPEGDVPVGPDTLFQVGSDTKKLTAMAVLRAVDRGELSLDDTVADVLGDLELALVPGWDDTATLHDLLSHQGGLYDYTPWEHDPDDGALASRAHGAFAEGGYAMAEAGSFFNYANPHYAVAALMLERATGRSWADAVHDDVFAPLGLESTWARLADVPLERAASGTGVADYVDPDPMDPWDAASYSWRTVAPDEQADNAFTRPAGLVWSTASDMAEVAAFLVDGDPAVLPDALRDELVAPHVEAYPGLPDLGTYGYGVFGYPTLAIGEDVYDVPLWVHGGNTLTMTSAFYVLPEQRLAVTVLSNGYGDDFSSTVVTALEALADLPAPRAAGPLPAAVPEDFVGDWADPFGVGTLSVTLDGDTLRVDAPGLDAAGVPHATVLEPYCQDVALLGIGGVDYDLAWIDGGRWVRNRIFVGEAGAAPASIASGGGAPLVFGPRPFANRLSSSASARGGR